jgi:3-oxoacyl-[acyl-carrier-protein] synthase II
LNYFAGDGSKFNPFFIPKMIVDIAGGHIPLNMVLEDLTTTVSACASSTNAIICFQLY